MLVHIVSPRLATLLIPVISMQLFVCGFCFDENRKRVVLIEKSQPAWQAGRLNGVGGKVEPGESVADAMTREFKEEAGVRLPAHAVGEGAQPAPGIWTPFCVLTLNGDVESTPLTGASSTAEVVAEKVRTDGSAGSDGRVVFFRAESTDAVRRVRTVETEPIRRLAVEDVSRPGAIREQCLPNLRWLIPLALDPEQTIAHAQIGGTL